MPSKKNKTGITRLRTIANKLIRELQRNQARVVNRFCSYLWVVVLIPVGRIRSLFDKFQIGCV
jgi:hypothetical protein